jgi:hypothetical protein
LKLAEVVTGLSSDLGDNEPGNENTAWSQADLLKWWNEARCVVASLRPDKYTCQKKIKLCSGTIQNHCECSSITQVLGQVDANGKFLGYVGKSSLTQNTRWRRRKVCDDVSSEDYRVSSYATTPTGDGTFMVTPEVPADADVYLSVMCRVSPKAMSNLNANVDDMDCAIQAVATQWVIGRAYESYDGPGAFNRSQAAFTLFFKLLNLQYSAELIAKSGVPPIVSAPR